MAAGAEVSEGVHSTDRFGHQHRYGAGCRADDRSSGALALGMVVAHGRMRAEGHDASRMS